ncbi:hypothetical protein [Paraburkholderia gardini]|uniref:hypothetical protein n=1 Tax=Paraburkholderia gardini TaxID=2823469 RepID=UPI001D6C6DA5|nr:hypothetical protein [Paraburkholderia gardini]CAG4889880.1 hypothetical protein R69919_00847 [Paraburkholderia gardini]
MYCDAWLGSLMLSITPTGHIDGYGTNGWAAVALVLLALAWISRVKAVDEQVSPVVLEDAGVQASR